MPYKLKTARNIIPLSSSEGIKPRDTIRVVAHAGECRVCVTSIPAVVSNKETMPLAASLKSENDQVTGDVVKVSPQARRLLPVTDADAGEIADRLALVRTLTYKPNFHDPVDPISPGCCRKSLPGVTPRGRLDGCAAS